MKTGETAQLLFSLFQLLSAQLEAFVSLGDWWLIQLLFAVIGLCQWKLVV